MIEYYKRRLKDKSIQKLKRFSVGCWINVYDPSEKEIKFLSRTFKLSEQNLLSGLDQDEVPRIDKDGGIYIYMRALTKNKELTTFLVILNEKFVLTLSKVKTSVVERLINRNVYTTQRFKFLLNILSELNKEFESYTLEIAKSVRKSIKKVGVLTEKEVNSLLQKEEALNNLIFYYHNMLILYNRILKNIKFYEQDKDIINDLIVEATEGFNTCKNTLKTVSNIRNYYMISLSNRLNKVINLLTLITILISIPSAVSGIYGMNIRLPLQSNPLAFYYILVFILLVWAGFILYLGKKKIF